MHEHGIAHRDIKPENVFVDLLYNLKAADFGFAVSSLGREGTGRCKTFLGTRMYMAPELCEHRHYSGMAVDLFAASIICFILVTGRPPFARAEANNPHYTLI
jgi:serine/threonine protein kinase